MGLRLLLALTISLGLLIAPQLEQRLEVRFTVTLESADGAEAPQTRLDLFHARAGQAMRAERRSSWPLTLEQPVSVRWEQVGLRPVARLRIDPLAAEGDILLGPITLSGPGGEQRLSGQQLLSAWQDVGGLEASLLADGRLLLRSLGQDPRFLLTVPTGIQHPGLSALWPGLPALALLTLPLWGLLSLWRRLAPDRGRQQTHATLVIGLCLLLSVLADSRISERPVAGDGAQNLRIAHNVAVHGAYSLDSEPPFRPTSVREPVPVLTTAAYLSLLDIGTGARDFPRLRSGDLLQDGKRIQLFWHALGLIAFGLLSLMLTGSLLLTTAVVLFSDALFFTPRVDLHYTELHAAALMGWVAVFGLAAVRAGGKGRRVLALLATGAALAALSLTKSLYFYGIPVFAGGLALALYWQARRERIAGPDIVQPLRRALLGATLVTLSAGLLTSPWLLRNQLVMGTLSLSEGRSGWVIHKRSLLNTLSNEQRLGAFVLYTPDGLREVLVALGLQADPPSYLQPDGLLAPLHIGASAFQHSDWQARVSGQPQNAVSFYQQSAARYVQLLNAGQAAGLDRPDLFADRTLTTIGLARIGSNPIDHLASTPLLLWRGLWMFPIRNGELPWLHHELTPRQVAGLNALAWLALIGLLGYGLRQQRAGALILVGLPLLSLAGYSLTSHNLPRFQAPLIPFLLLALVWSGQLLGQALVSSGSRRLRRSRGTDPPERRCSPRR